jgi:hypothetical protein
MLKKNEFILYLTYFPSIACIASSASARCLKFTKAKQGGFVAIQT